VQSAIVSTNDNKAVMYMGGIIAAGLLIAIVPLVHLISFAAETGEQSYILLVPLISAGLIYYNRDRIFRTPTLSFKARSLALLTPGVLLIVAAYVFTSGSEAQMVLTALGLIVLVVAGFHACFGPLALRAGAFELGMLLWMVPIPQPAIDWMTYTLQRGSTEVVDWLFTLVRVPVLRDGFFFHLPGQSIEVAKQCSGIRSTLSLLLLTMILAHESLRSNWRRLILVLCALPIVVLKNGVRIVTLTLLAIKVDPSFLTGSLHHDGGIVFFLLGLVILMPIIGLLRKGDQKPLVAAAAAND
jgi:exosortase